MRPRIGRSLLPSSPTRTAVGVLPPASQDSLPRQTALVQYCRLAEHAQGAQGRPSQRPRTLLSPSCLRASCPPPAMTGTTVAKPRKSSTKGKSIVQKNPCVQLPWRILPQKRADQVAFVRSLPKGQSCSVCRARKVRRASLPTGLVLACSFSRYTGPLRRRKTRFVVACLPSRRKTPSTHRLAHSQQLVAHVYAPHGSRGRI